MTESTIGAVTIGKTQELSTVPCIPPEALIAFLDADDFEHTLQLVISLGGDADTQGAIAGAVAEAFWGGVPEEIENAVLGCLPEDMERIIEAFHVPRA